MVSTTDLTIPEEEEEQSNVIDLMSEVLFRAMEDRMSLEKFQRYEMMAMGLDPNSPSDVAEYKHSIIELMKGLEEGSNE